jgi:hypothetical protein
MRLDLSIFIARMRKTGPYSGMEIVARKFSSFAESDRSDREYYRSLTPEQRLDILPELVAWAQADEIEQGFAGVYRVVKLHES